MPHVQTFGSVLRTLLFESGLYGIAGWARELEVSCRHLSLWIGDNAYPTPSQLARLLKIIRQSKPNLMRVWDEVAYLPLFEVTPLIHLLPVSYRAMPNLAMYELWDDYELMLAKLATFSITTQREFLKYVSEECIAGLEQEKNYCA